MKTNIQQETTNNKKSDQLGLQFTKETASQKSATLTPAINHEQIQQLLDNLFSDEIETRRQTVRQLINIGPAVAKHLVSMLTQNPLDATKLFRLTYALEELGKLAVPPLLESLDNIKDFGNPTNITLLETIVDTLIRVHDKNAIPWLVDKTKELKSEIRKIQKATPADNNKNDSSVVDEKRIGLYQNARLRIHVLLGEMGSSDGLDDLLTLLGNGKTRVHEDIIETIVKIGDKRALVPLLRLYPLELSISELGARFIKLTIRNIIRREKIDRSDPIFKKLSAEEKTILEKLFPNMKHHNNK
ncbi:hypothetical protein ACFL5I_00940 [Planctomycetota bacterium]